MGATDLTPIDVLATLYDELNMLQGIVNITSWGIHTINLRLIAATFRPHQQSSSSEEVCRHEMDVANQF